MRILFFSDHFRPEPSAPAAHVYERARIWLQKGHAVTIVTSVPNYPEGRPFAGYRNRIRQVEDMDGIRVVRVGTFMAANEGVAKRTLDYASYTLSAGLLAHLEPRADVVVSTSPHLFVPLAGVNYAALRRLPHVFELRDLWPASIHATGAAQLGRGYRMLERLELSLYRRSARVLSFTESFREDLIRRGVPAQKIDVVLNGANLDLFRPQPRDEELARRLGVSGRFVIGYLGTLGLAHDLENVLETADRLRRVRPDVVFLFVGVGAAKAALEAEAARRDLGNVIFTGRQLKEDMPAFWSVCDVALVHLRNDPVFSTVVPSKIFEGMAVGRPILYVGPEGEGSAIVRRHDAGLVVPPADPARFAEAIGRLLDDPNRRAQLAANALAAAPNYSRERQAVLALETFRKAIDGV